MKFLVACLSPDQILMSAGAHSKCAPRDGLIEAENTEPIQDEVAPKMKVLSLL